MSTQLEHPTDLVEWASDEGPWAAVVLVAGILLYHVVGIWLLYSRFYDKIIEQFGWDRPGAMFGAAVATTAVMWCAWLVVFYLATRRHKAHAIVYGLVGVGTYSLLLITAGRTVCFDPSGKPLKWFADTPDGRVYFSRPGVVPSTGVRLAPYTPEQAAKDGPQNACVPGAFRPAPPLQAGGSSTQKKVDSGHVVQ